MAVIDLAVSAFGGNLQFASAHFSDELTSHVTTPGDDFNQDYFPGFLLLHMSDSLLITMTQGLLNFTEK